MISVWFYCSDRIWGIILKIPWQYVDTYHNESLLMAFFLHWLKNVIHFQSCRVNCVILGGKTPSRNSWFSGLNVKINLLSKYLWSKKNLKPPLVKSLFKVFFNWRGPDIKKKWPDFVSRSFLRTLFLLLAPCSVRSPAWKYTCSWTWRIEDNNLGDISNERGQSFARMMLRMVLLLMLMNLMLLMKLTLLLILILMILLILMLMNLLPARRLAGENHPAAVQRS